MTMPTDIGAIDLMISFPKANASKTYDYLRETTRGDDESHAAKIRWRQSGQNGQRGQAQPPCERGQQFLSHSHLLAICVLSLHLIFF